MTAISIESVRRRIRQIDSMPLFSHERYHFAIETVRQADVLKNPDLQFETRYDLCMAATTVGEYQVSLDTFTWCITQYDRYPDRFSLLWLFRMYKWMIADAIEFPSIGREQILSLLEDFGERLRASGGSERAYWFYRDRVAYDLKDFQFLKENLFRWREHPRDQFCDCPACEEDFRISFFSFLGEYESAIKVSEGIIHQKMKCASVPHRTFAEILHPLLELGLTEKAHEAHVKGYRMIYDKPGLASCVFDHIEYLILTGDLKKAASLFEKHLGDALEMSGPASFHVPLITWLLTERLLSQGKKRIKLRLPSRLDFFQPSGVYDIKQLRTHFKTITKDLATRFDTRNGNTFHGNEIQRVIWGKE
ncbi:hypothetical protein QUF72_16960 [Desulfobacterales bacterium HSG2]|nr:hypothetical protein [Desulfobacterales bacterium HSG2]